MTAKKKKVELTDECKAGRHTFIVTVSMTKGGLQKATTMRCQSCLIPLSVEEIEMREWKESEKVV